jgi:hypothetical protein
MYGHQKELARLRQKKFYDAHKAKLLQKKRAERRELKRLRIEVAELQQAPAPARFTGSFSKKDFRQTFSLDVTNEESQQFRESLGSLASDEARITEILTKNPGIVPLSELIKIAPETLTPNGRLDYLSALEKQSGWLQAFMQRAIIAVAGEEESRSPDLFLGVDESEREDISSVLRLAPMTAQSRIDVARTLTQELPQTCAALAAGEISSAHANVIAREGAEAIRAGLDSEQIKELEIKALGFAEFHTPSQVTKKIRGLVAKMSPQTFEEKVEIATKERSVYLSPETDGMARIIAFLPAQDAQTVILAINRIARKERQIIREAVDQLRKKGPSIGTRGVASGIESDSSSELLNDLSSDLPNDLSSEISSDLPNDLSDGTIGIEMDNLRADALVKLATTFLSSNKETLPEHRRPVALNVTMDLPTLMGLAENPAQLWGYGAIPASIGRKLATEGKWRRFITDPITGNLLDFGRDSYLPPQHLVDFLMARDRTCRFPGCSQPAHRTDIDHAKPWEEAGETSAQNLGLLCRRHHRLKTHDGWKLESFPDGSCEWTSPEGRKYFVPSRPIDEVA